jgi:prephenate dehydrogenase
LKSKNISIIGLGLIGGSIAKALKASGTYISISAFDKNKEPIKKALKEKVIDEELSSLDLITDSDMIFICLPADESLKIFASIIPKLSNRHIISDVCGVKSAFEEKWIDFRSDAHYIGGHPMTGKEVGGYENSDAHLFKNTIYIISELAKKCSKINEFLDFVMLIGAKPLFLDPHLHDKIVARVSHLPQLLAVALVHSVGNNEEGINFLDYAAGGFRDLTRISSSPFTSWESILRINREEIINAIEILYDNLHKIEDNLACDNIDSIGKLFHQARVKREKITKDSKGFLNPLHDVYLELEDKPGTLKKVINLIFDHGINLKDIELQKFIDKYGGVFKLSFETKQDARKIKTLLIQAGYKLKD